jgi:hypothetical protein
MMPSNNNYAAWVYGSLQRNAARFCSTERLQTQILCGGMSACGRTRSSASVSERPRAAGRQCPFSGSQSGLANGITAVDW